jgi:hypothetical protein
VRVEVGDAVVSKERFADGGGGGDRDAMAIAERAVTF